MLRCALLASVVAVAVADCPNGCSDNGQCGPKDQCSCDAGYFGADCSLRTCPSDFAFVDTPAGDLNHDGAVENTYLEKPLSTSGAWAYELFPLNPPAGKGFAAVPDEAHFYKECSGTGTCDRALGQCKCFAGYTGAACQRSTCPNDCSGKGVCRTLREVAAGALSRRVVGSAGGNSVVKGVRAPFDYSLWDADKHQMCVCDAGFDGVDCSERTCPRGDDPLTKEDDPRWCGGKACAWEAQQFELKSDAATTFAFKFVDTRNFTHVAYATVDTGTNPAGIVSPANVATHLPGTATNAGLIMAALRGAPGGVLQQVEVRAIPTPITNMADLLTKKYQVTFVGLSGDQYDMTIEAASGPGGVKTQPFEVVKGNKEDFECSGRGICDKAQSLCKCFSGYFGAACEYQNALAGGSSGGGSSGGSSK